ncbi:polysaccharide biosynthesis/export family protein [Maritimibacter sp. DP1N21-5]|uniref:polysaccharide biosynthesis/export family protein n=1 Tax=Maritimibacter sp. DP1N21-5 TaxID=2836867 RepID=UPI001C47ABC3|nr:polysaccharide biosynthesis/export family protein [Maritimibacter sp. DP1N21-5]MBV7410320.1 polysaccharide biosynthesis/export family protein [Maritimibacter sp. DP1N21-5]
MNRKQPMNTVRQGLSPITLALACLPFLGVLPPTVASAQELSTVQVSRGYPLGAGDVLRLEFLNRPDIALSIPVELTGYANFPFAGSVLVAGRTVEELRAELPVLLQGAVLREEVGNDMRSNKVEGSELILSVQQYRPVVVAGDVTEPGEVDFSVGMTVRMAIFKAQGIGSLRNGSSESINLFRTRAEIGRVVTRHAVLAALVEERDAVTVDSLVLPTNTGLSAENIVGRANADLALERAKIEQEKGREQLRIDTAAERVTSSRARVESLEAAEADEIANVERLEALMERRLVSSEVMNDARRNSLQTSEFRRKASDDASSAMLEWEELVVTARIENINRQQLWRTEMNALDAELDVLMVALASAWGQDATATVYRQTVTGVEHLTLRMDDMLMPGDMVELDQTWVGQ